MQIELNPGLDVAKLAADFQLKKRLRIDNILTASSAGEILDCLKNQTAWELIYSNAESAPMRVSHQQLEQSTVEEIKALHAQVYKRATASYQYWYKFFPMVEAIRSGRINEKSRLNEIATFLNSAEFINFARAVTNHSTLVKVDPHATLYEPGDFKNLHDDMPNDGDASDMSVPRYALAMDFTDHWSVNWGGDMRFYTRQNPTTCETFYPGFNTLTLFEIPALYRNNMVAPFAAKGRYGIAGWLLDDPSVTRADLDEPAAAQE